MQLLMRSTFIENTEDIYGKKYWKMMKGKDYPYSQLADYALRFMTISASEANCESIISRARFIQGDHHQRDAQELKEAHFQLVTHSHLLTTEFQ